MGKKKSWVNLLKGFFLFETPSKREKKDKKKTPKWLFRSKKLASIKAPSPAPRESSRTSTEPEEEQKKPAFLPEAVVHLKNVTDHQIHKEEQENAAIRIQAAFRAYLAKKAFRALKGIVMLQAIIRGGLVRRQAMATLKRLQSIVNIQSQVCNKRAEGSCQCENKQLQQSLRDKIIKVDTNSEKRWDGSLLTKEEADAINLSKKEAAFMRERMKEYGYIHRKSAESEQEKGNGRMKYWLDQWVDTHQQSKSKELEDLDSVWNSDKRHTIRQLKLRTTTPSPRLINNTIGGILSSPTTIPRRHFHHRKQSSSLGEENSFSGSPIVPTYMAATASAKAKSRSTSSPRQRFGSFDTQSESHSPCKYKYPLVTCDASIISKPTGCKQRSPGLKGISVPVKSTRMLNDLSINSECSLPSWYQSQRNFRSSF